MLGSKRHGFTFLEIIIVVAIMGILVTFIAPNFRNLLPGYSRKQFIAKLNGLMRVAWHDAVVTHKLHKILFDIEKRTVDIQIESGKQGDEYKFSSIKTPFLNSLYQWSDDNFEFKNFYIGNRDEITSAFKSTGKGKIWYFITPDGLSQPVTLNIVDIKDSGTSAQGVQFSLVLNPFSVQFKEYDVFQKPK